ncbi:MAG: hypothetical protein RM049_34720 [Nostoc sp. DedQUE04]|uniref:hypothetical protein n=1 Tax=Nostoc sp. DedQUE04 TaxID=3075390 RepID=UPI002AD28EE2|nr:hypothetical protein [Nostoc sp. DedQUE04]MDZ8140390.1 hypothetical protein [Nostoc sp. DedQUE04]
MKLRNHRLYRSTHKTFEDYCRERFGFSRRQPYHLMEAAVIFDNLVAKCERNVHILPTNEWQVRLLAKLDPDIQPEAWQQAALVHQRENILTPDCQRLSAEGAICLLEISINN